MDIQLDSTASGGRGGSTVHLRTGSEAVVRSIIHPAVSQVIGHDSFEVSVTLVSVYKYFSACVLITMIQTFQWIGWWNALTMYTWPWPEWQLYRDIAYMVIGVFMIFISNRFFSLDEIREQMVEDWRYGIPKSFSWFRKLRNFAKKTLNFAAFVTTWVGAWNIFDEYILEASLFRDLAYIFFPIILGLIVEEFLSTESIYYMMAKLRASDEEWLPPDIESQNIIKDERSLSFNNRANSVLI